jgi:hypothetical protein
LTIKLTPNTQVQSLLFSYGNLPIPARYYLCFMLPVRYSVVKDRSTTIHSSSVR